MAGTGTFLLLSPFRTGLADPDQREESFRIRIWPRLGEIFRPVENTPIFNNIKKAILCIKIYTVKMHNFQLIPTLFASLVWSILRGRVYVVYKGRKPKPCFKI